jgi:hypothetical protein
MIIAYWMSGGSAFVFGPPAGVSDGQAFFLSVFGAFGINLMLLATLSDLEVRTNRFQVCIFYAGLAFTFDTCVGAYSGGPFNPLWALVTYFSSTAFDSNITTHSKTSTWVYFVGDILGLLAAFAVHALYAIFLPERSGGHPASHPSAQEKPSSVSLTAPVKRKVVLALLPAQAKPQGGDSEIGATSVDGGGRGRHGVAEASHGDTAFDPIDRGEGTVDSAI